MTVDRLSCLKNWLAQQFSSVNYTITPLSGDAIFRRYFRVKTPSTSYVVMDAPPDKENAAYFAKLARLIAAQGVRVPQVFAENATEGFLLLSDFGDAQLLDFL